MLWFAPSLLGQATAPASSPQPVPPPESSAVCSSCIRAHMEVLASDDLRGRGSGTEDEHRAANYIASVLRQYGIPPATPGDYLQQADVILRKPTGPAQITFELPEGKAKKNIAWTQGKEILIVNLSHAEASGPLQTIANSGTQPEIKPGTVVYLRTAEGTTALADLDRLFEHGAAAVLVPETAAWRARWEARGKRLVHLPGELAGDPEQGLGESANLVVLSAQAQNTLREVPDGAIVHLQVPTKPPETSHTWNVVAMLRGSDPNLRQEAVLFSAHLDHLGVGVPVNGDSIYNGADDDASGVCAVLELARVLSAGRRPRRTVIFALFGSEEAGGMGSLYFRAHPPVPLARITANLEFEMIGRADPAVAADTLWLTGWDKSNLGPELAARGAKLVADPHPEQGFFTRSDNYVLAKKGVVAQTVSSFGLHKDYHQPSDDLAHIDFAHMNAAIGSLLKPVEWLVNSDFTPKWVKPVTSD